jgi:hypothetical protein
LQPVKNQSADCKGRAPHQANVAAGAPSRSTPPSPDDGGLFTPRNDAHHMSHLLSPNRPPARPADPHEPAAVLRRQFPALARLLGEPAFAQVSSLAAGHSAAQGVPVESDSGVAPRAFVHGLLVHGDVLAPDGVPARLLADVAALEAALADVQALAPRAQHEPRLTEADLQALTAEARDAAALRPTRALRLVPVAYRLATWLRDVHEGRSPAPPRRGEQHVAFYALPGLLSAHDETPITWWHGLPPGEGLLLARAALGVPLGQLRAEALARRWIASEEELDASLAGWVREGLFAEIVSGA